MGAGGKGKIARTVVEGAGGDGAAVERGGRGEGAAVYDIDGHPGGDGGQVGQSAGSLMETGGEGEVAAGVVKGGRLKGAAVKRGGVAEGAACGEVDGDVGADGGQVGERAGRGEGAGRGGQVARIKTANGEGAAIEGGGVTKGTAGGDVDGGVGGEGG